MTNKPHIIQESHLITVTANQVLEDSKAEEIISINLKGRSDVADTMLIATGRSNRHVRSIAENISQALKKQGAAVYLEGMVNGDWVLIDAGDLVIHLFQPEVRSYYRLEQMWIDDPDTSSTVLPAQS